VKGELKKKIVKEVKVDLDKCSGCRACEVACSAFHAKPKSGSINPARSRIRMVIDELNDVYVPIRAGHYTKAVWAETNIRLTERNATSVASAGLRAHPESFSKNPIPVSL
jgi:benzoyl-CoA reductase subunit BamC